MGRHKDVETVDSETLRANCREKVNVGQSYDGYRQEIIKMLQEYKDMWDGRLGQLGIAKHRIVLTSTDIWPINFVPYRAGRKEREFEKMEIDKMIRMNVIEPRDSEWASPFLFAPKKDESLQFLCQLS